MPEENGHADRKAGREAGRNNCRLGQTAGGETGRVAGRVGCALALFPSSTSIAPAAASPPNTARRQAPRCSTRNMSATALAASPPRGQRPPASPPARNRFILIILIVGRNLNLYPHCDFFYEKCNRRSVVQPASAVETTLIWVVPTKHLLKSE